MLYFYWLSRLIFVNAILEFLVSIFLVLDSEFFLPCYENLYQLEKYIMPYRSWVHALTWDKNVGLHFNGTFTFKRSKAFELNWHRHKVPYIGVLNKLKCHMDLSSTPFCIWPDVVCNVSDHEYWQLSCPATRPQLLHYQMVAVFIQ